MLSTKNNLFSNVRLAIAHTKSRTYIYMISVVSGAAVEFGTIYKVMFYASLATYHHLPIYQTAFSQFNPV